MKQIRELEQTEYPAFLAMWAEAFGDGPETHRAFKQCYGNDLADYILTDDMAGENIITAALTQFVMGKYISSTGTVTQDVLVSYAINSSADLRGRGYGIKITEFARDKAISANAISMLCPADEGLIEFYRKLEYRPCCYAEEVAIECSELAPQGDFTIMQIDAAEWNEYREQILCGRSHLALTTNTIKYIAETSAGFYAISDSSRLLGIAVIDSPSDDITNRTDIFILELLTADKCGGDMACASQLAAAIAKHSNKKRAVYRLPASSSSPTKRVQALVYPAKSENLADEEFSPYFGFPFD